MKSVRLFNAKGEHVDVPEDHPKFKKYEANFPLKEAPKAKPPAGGKDTKPPTGGK